jgi:hypothetical protein
MEDELETMAATPCSVASKKKFHDLWAFAGITNPQSEGNK